MSLLVVQNQTLNLAGNPKNYSEIDIGVSGSLNVNTPVFSGFIQVTGSAGVIDVLSGFLDVISPLYSSPTLVYGAGSIISFIGAQTEGLKKQAYIVKHAIPARGEILQYMGYHAPEISIKGFFTGSDILLLKPILESICLTGITGSLYPGIDLYTGSYNVYLESIEPSLKGGYFESYVGQGYVPYSLNFVVIT